MYFDPRSLLFFVANVLLLHLMLMVNSALAIWAIFPVLLGPMIVFPALYMRHSAYFLCTLCTGLWVDVALPLPFGWMTGLFLCSGVLVFALRKRFRAEENHHPILLAHALNVVAVGALAMPRVHDLYTVPDFWIQTALTIILSQLLLTLVAPWFFNLQRLLLELLHLETKPEDLPLL